MLFSIVVDYMALPALSAILLPELQISTKEFGLVISVYAFSAGISGFIAASFADSFDRKKLLMIYYGGFLLGMVLCAAANSLTALIMSRIVTGVFGGVVASICFAIVADLFAPDQRGRVMGYVQLAFAASHIAGLPLALYLATHFDWHLMYALFFAFGLFNLGFIFFKIKPINQHLATKEETSLLQHSSRIIGNRDYWMVFSNNTFIVLGDVMFMTFSAAYLTANLGVNLERLPLLFGIGGVATIVLSPIIGELTDRYGRLRIFMVGTVLAVVSVAILSNLGSCSFWQVVVVHTLLFIGVNARMIAATATTTLMPNQQDRGTFMALDASFQQLAGGAAATAAGWIIFKATDGQLHGFSTLGWVVIGVMLVTLGLMYAINAMVERNN